MQELKMHGGDFIKIFIKLISLTIFIAFNTLRAEESPSCPELFNLFDQNFNMRKELAVYKKNENLINLNAQLEILNGLKKLKDKIDKELYAQFRTKPSNENSLKKINELQKDVNYRLSVFYMESASPVCEDATEISGTTCAKKKKVYDNTSNPVLDFALNYKAAGYFDNFMDNDEDIIKKFKKYLIDMCSHDKSETHYQNKQKIVMTSFFKSAPIIACGEDALDNEKIDSQKTSILSFFKLVQSDKNASKISISDPIKEQQTRYYEKLEEMSKNIEQFKQKYGELNKKYEKVQNGQKSDSYLKELSQIVRDSRVSLESGIEMNDKSITKFNAKMRELDPLWPSSESKQIEYVSDKWNSVDENERINKQRFFTSVGKTFKETVNNFEKFQNWKEEGFIPRLESVFNKLTPYDYKNCNLETREVETATKNYLTPFLGKLFNCVGLISIRSLESEISDVQNKISDAKSELEGALLIDTEGEYANLDYIAQNIAVLIKENRCNRQNDQQMLTQLNTPCVVNEGVVSKSFVMLVNNEKKVVRQLYLNEHPKINNLSLGNLIEKMQGVSAMTKNLLRQKVLE